MVEVNRISKSVFQHSVEGQRLVLRHFSFGLEQRFDAVPFTGNVCTNRKPSQGEHGAVDQIL